MVSLEIKWYLTNTLNGIQVTIKKPAKATMATQSPGTIVVVPLAIVGTATNTAVIVSSGVRFGSCIFSYHRPRIYFATDRYL